MQQPNKTGNPALPNLPLVSLCVLTHYTDHPYHKNRWDVVTLCIDSMLAGLTDSKVELIVWDNGSLPAFREMIQSRYHPQIYVTSENIGTDAGRRGLWGVARGKYFCYSDDDIYYYPNWFTEHMKLLRTYPEVGCVSGSPQRTAFRWGIQSNLKKAEQYQMHLKTGRLISDKDEQLYSDSIGRDWHYHQQITTNDIDYSLEYKGVRAWAHAHHCQFVSERDKIGPAATLQGNQIMGDGKAFDKTVDDMGLMRLTTYKRTTLHIGNALDDTIKSLAVMHGFRAAIW